MRLFLYILLMIGTGYVMVMYDMPWCMELLVFEVAVLVISWLMSRWMCNGLQIDFTLKSQVVQKKTKTPLYIEAKNHHRIPLLRFEVLIILRNNDDAVGEKYKITSAVDGKSQTVAEVLLSSDYCGIMTAEVVNVKVYDYLKLFSFKKKVDKRAEIVVIPTIYPASIDVISGFRYFSGDGDVYSENESGNDPSEIFEIRPYRSGDKIQKIHWKLTAKSDEMMVKEHSEPIGFAVVILMDFSGEMSAERFDNQLTAAVSISNQLAEDGYSHYFSWMKNNGEFMRFKIVEAEDIYSVLPYMIKRGGTKNIEAVEDDVAERYNEKYGRSSYHTMLRLDLDLNLYKEKNFELKLEAKDLSASLLNMNLEI